MTKKKAIELLENYLEHVEKVYEKSKAEFDSSPQDHLDKQFHDVYKFLIGFLNQVLKELR